MQLKKLVALLLAMLMTLGTLAGCGSDNNSTTEAPATTDSTEVPTVNDTTEVSEETTEEPTPDYSMYRVTEPITIDFWYNGSANQAFYDEIVAEFNALSNETLVTVNAECIGAYSAIKTQLTSAHQSQQGLPAVTAMNFPAVPIYYESGVFDDITELLAANGFDTEDILSGVMDQVTIDGHIAAVPWGPSASVYYYNKTELAKHGLDDFPDTWEDFKKWCKDVFDATGVPAYTCDATAGGAIIDYIMSFGGDFQDSNDPTKTALGEERAVEKMKEFQELIDAGYVVWSIEGSSIISSAFLQGHTMSYYASSTGYDAILESIEELEPDKQFEVGLSWTWGDVKRVTTVAGASLAVPKEISQEQKNAAGVFLTWLVSPENQKRWAEFSSYFMIHKSNINDQAVIDDVCESLPELKNIYPLLVENYTMKPQSQYYDSAMKVFVTALQEIYINKADFDSTYQTMIEDIEYILAGN